MDIINEQNDFLKHNDIIIEKANEESSEVRLEISKKALNTYGIVHGGLIFSLGDTVMGITCRSTGRDAVTLDASINFVKPGRGKYLSAIMSSTYYFIN